MTNRTLAFLVNETGISPARQEFESLLNSRHQDLTRVLAHLSYVNLLPSGAVLAQSQQFESLSPTIPTIYWWNSGDVGAFYTQDENNTIVILFGVSKSSHEFAHLLNTARERIINA